MKAALDSNFLRKDRDLAQRCNRFLKGLLAPARLFEKPPLKCYQSDLHHALNFAYSEQKTRVSGLGYAALNLVPGRGSRRVAWLLFRQGAIPSPTDVCIHGCLRPGAVA